MLRVHQRSVGRWLWARCGGGCDLARKQVQSGIDIPQQAPAERPSAWWNLECSLGARRGVGIGGKRVGAALIEMSACHCWRGGDRHMVGRREAVGSTSAALISSAGVGQFRALGVQGLVRGRPCPDHMQTQDRVLSAKRHRLPRGVRLGALWASGHAPARLLGEVGNVGVVRGAWPADASSPVLLASSVGVRVPGRRAGAPGVVGEAPFPLSPRFGRWRSRPP